MSETVSMDHLDAVQAFVTVAELRSFSAAARKLRRSAPMVTRLVAALEGRLGLRLLQRTTRSVALTGPGARYLEGARRILVEVEQADAIARAQQTAPSGRLVVTGPALFGRLHLAPLFCEFLARHPAVRGELLLADRVVNLVEEGVDVALRIGHLADSSLVARKVGQTARVLVAAPRYLASHGRPRSPEALAEHRHIHFTGLSAQPEWRFEWQGRSLVHRFEPTLTTNSGDAAIAHAVLGGGITLALAYQVAAEVKAGALKVLLADSQPEPLPIQCVFASARLLSPASRAFVEVVSAQRWHFAAR